MKVLRKININITMKVLRKININITIIQLHTVKSFFLMGTKFCGLMMMEMFMDT